MSIQDVAKLAKVSISTVSRVINGHSSVDPKNAEVVRRAMKTLGYAVKEVRPGRVPHAAKATGQPGSGNLGVVLAGRSRELFENPYMSRMLAAMTQAAKGEHRNLMIIEMANPDELPKAVQERQVEGAILLGGNKQEAWAKTLSFLPCVSLSRLAVDDLKVDQILHDAVKIGGMAVEYLVGKGCRKLASLNHDPKHGFLMERCQHFAAVAKQREVFLTEWVPDTMASTDADVVWSTDTMRSVLDELVGRMVAAKERPDGLFVPSDHQMMFVHMCLRQRGVEPERDIRLISCGNNEPWLAAMSPRPATIDPGTIQDGREAVHRLIFRIKYPQAQPAAILSTPQLIVPHANKGVPENA